MTQKRTTLLIFFILTLFASCNSDKIEPNIVDLSNEYFPIENDKEEYFEIYHIDYTIFGSDTSHFFQKERTKVIYKDQDSLYAITTMLTSDSLDGVFKTVSTKSITIERNELIENIENERFLQMRFPIYENLNFNINSYNLQDEQLASVIDFETDIETTDFLNTQIHKQSLKIELQNNNNIILSVNHFKIHQKENGLVYEYDEDIDQQPNQDPIGYKTIKIKIEN